MTDRTVRRLAVGGIVGPAAFVATWATAGAVASDYSPISDPISQLAEIGADTRWAMTAGFVAFAAGVAPYALALRATLPGPAWLAALGTAGATLGVAALPLGSDATDGPHGVAAALAYATLAATPLLAARTYAGQGQHRRARWAVATGVVSAACLAATAVAPAHGLLQRVGLTVTDAWIVWSALGIVRGGRR